MPNEPRQRAWARLQSDLWAPKSDRLVALEYPEQSAGERSRRTMAAV